MVTQTFKPSVFPDDITEDVGPLVWILREVDHTLDAVRQSLRKFTQEQSERGREGGIADTSPLRTARSQLHQATGAVEVVGLAGAPSFLKALEAAVGHCVEQPEALTPQSLADLEKAMNALHEYLQSALSGRKPQPLKLFVNYAAVLKISASDRIHPADLWDNEFEWRDVKPAAPPNESASSFSISTSHFDRAILLLLRGKGPEAAEQLKPVLEASYAQSNTRSAKSFWAIACAVAEALAKHAIKADDHLKRAFTRMSLQIRSQLSSSGELSERLARDLLFFASQSAPIASERSIWLGPVLEAYGLTHSDRVDYTEHHYAAVDPAVLQLAQRRVGSLKQLWAELSNGDVTRIRAVSESADLVAESLSQLNPKAAGGLGTDLSKLIKRSTARTEEMTADRALEVANTVLFLEASLQSGEINGGLFSEREAALSKRLQKSLAGEAAGPMDSWMENLYRKSSEAQTMGSVVQELKTSMTTVETALDRYFRNSNDRETLAQVPVLLSQARGVLSVLGFDHASAAVAHARSVTENWVLAEGPAATAESHLLAQNLGALSFMVDLLGYQPAAAKAMFEFDSLTNEFRSSLRETVKAPKQEKIEKRLDQSAHINAALDKVATQLAEPHLTLDQNDTNALASKLEALKVEAAIADAPQMQIAAGTALDALRAGNTEQAANLLQQHIASVGVASSLPDAQAQSSVHASANHDFGDDDDLLDIFLDEATEVTETGELQIASLRQSPNDQESLVTLRRSFHTLKGSSRMVGLSSFGESAWQFEQVLNAYLSEPKSASPALLDLSGDALTQFKRWVGLIKTHKSSHSTLVPDTWVAAFTASAEAFKHGGAYQPIVLDEPIGAQSTTDRLATSHDTETIDVGLQDFEVLDTFNVKPVAPTQDNVVHQAYLETLDTISLDLNTPDAKITEERLEDVKVESIQSDEMSLDEFFAAAGIPADHSHLVDSASTVQAQAIDTKTALLDGAEVALAANTAQVLMHPSALPLAPVADDEYKQIGDLRIPISLYNIYLSEADELARKLTSELDMWRLETQQHGEHIVPEGAVAAAHTLAGSSATVSFTSLANLGYDLEAALLACQSHQHAPSAHDHEVLNATAEEMRKLLHQFATGSIKEVNIAAAQNIALLKTNWQQTSQDQDMASKIVATPPHEEASTPSVEAAALTPAIEELQAANQSTTFLQNSLDVTPAAVAFTAPVAAVAVASAADVAPTATIVNAPTTKNLEDDELSDTIDPDLFPIFEEEAQELLPKLALALRSWQSAPNEFEAPKQSLRVLHTFKGSARLAGAMHLGEMAHQLEAEVEFVLRETPSSAAITPLVEQCDDIVARFEQIRSGEVHSSHEYEYHVTPAATATTSKPLASEIVAHNAIAQATFDAPVSATQSSPAFKLTALAAAASTTPTNTRTQQAVRVKAGLLDRLFNQAGEVSITRARLENEIGSIKGSLGDLTDNLSRLREQLRAIELQAETQMQSRLAATREASDFDPLEFDRFTRFQELTRMMAESVNDVATVQQTLNRTIVTTEDDLQRQARMTRELQRDLLRTRMVEFESLSERLYRVVRQVAKELGKNVRLDIAGGQIEIDRGVLERMSGSFEHLLRNCVAHGIELPEERTKNGKPDTGQIDITLKQEGNEVSIVFSDDGAGLNFARIREKAAKLNLLDANTQNNESALAELIFAAGFSTAETISEISGRGIGMDVVKSEILGLGGRVTVATQPSKGTTFTLVLPLTTAVTQIVLVRTGSLTVGLPSSLIEIVQRIKGAELSERYSAGVHNYSGLNIDFYPFGRLLQATDGAIPAGAIESRANPIIVVRSAAQRIALHVDEILGNQEVVVRNLGPQLSRVPGLAGMSVLASGSVVLIYNPVALASVYGTGLRVVETTPKVSQAQLAANAAGDATPSMPIAELRPIGYQPSVMVVDDSLTVRRVTQRLLMRNGYRVILAKDGLDALEVLQTESPDIMLLDIEMPRMDGFDLTRNMRSTTSTDKLRKLPIVMITSRIADKHKTLAMELGVSHYLGKPYNEDDLLRLIAEYTGTTQVPAAVN